MPQLYLKGPVQGCLGSWWGWHFCMLLTCTRWGSAGQADACTLLCEDLLLRYVIVYKLQCKPQCCHYGFHIFFDLDWKLKASFAFILCQFLFQALCFLLYCLPSAVLEWFLNICTEIKTSGTVSRSLPCKENLDIVINVGWMTSLTLKALCNAHCVIEHVFVKTMQHFSWPLVFTTLPSVRPLLSLWSFWYLSTIGAWCIRVLRICFSVAY